MALPDTRRGLYNKLSGDSGITALVSTRIYFQQAPASAALPYLVFDRVATSHNNELYRTATDELWQVMAVAISPTTCEAIINAVHTALNHLSLNLSGFTNWNLKTEDRYSDLEMVNGEQTYLEWLEIRINVDS